MHNIVISCRVSCALSSWNCNLQQECLFLCWGNLLTRLWLLHLAYERDTDRQFRWLALWENLFGSRCMWQALRAAVALTVNQVRRTQLVTAVCVWVCAPIDDIYLCICISGSQSAVVAVAPVAVSVSITRLTARQARSAESVGQLNCCSGSRLHLVSPLHSHSSLLDLLNRSLSLSLLTAISYCGKYWITKSPSSFAAVFRNRKSPAHTALDFTAKCAVGMPAPLPLPLLSYPFLLVSSVSCFGSKRSRSFGNLALRRVINSIALLIAKLA